MKRYLDKLGVAGRIMTMPVIAIVCMAILFGVAYTGFAKLNGTVDNLYNQRFANHKASATLLAETTQLHANLYKLLSWINAGYDKAQIDPFVAEQKGALPNIEYRIAGLLGSEKLGDQERRQLQAAAAHLKDYATATADMLDVAETDTTYAAVLMGTTDDKFQQLKKTLDELSALEDALGKEGYLSAEQDSTTGIRNSLLVAAIALLISGLLAFIITRSVKRPLSAMQEAIVLIGGSRDLTIRVPVTSSDELGNMGRHLNATLGQVADSMRTVVTVADRVADHAEHLAGATVRLTESSHAQAATAAEMAAAVEQITVSIGSVAEHAAETEALTGQASAHVTQGATVVEEVSRQMSLNAEQMTESSSHIARLAEQSRQVGGIVQVIRDIADQTNLLALNAAIEAARAGETGRGFAVVADEVRKLAERTATATAEIGQLIENIQHEVATVVDSMDTSTRLADKSASLAAEAGRVFTEISGSASQAADRVHDIAVAAREQSSAGQGIAGNVEKVARMTEENSAATESIASAATQLKQQAAHLDEAVSRFRV